MIERLYRLLLPLFPRAFRDRFEAEMLDTARSLDAEGRRGFIPAARALSDAVVTPMRLRAELRYEARSFTPARQIPMTSFIRDINYAIRGLGREPGFTLFVSVTLALGIGANAAMFGIADRLLLRGPAHVRDADRVVRLYFTEQPPGMREFTTSGFGYVTYAALHTGTPAFERFATYAINEAVAGRGADARQIRAGYATASLFPLLGVQPVLGRFFTEDEDAPKGADKVAVLSHRLWTSAFAASRDVLGQTIVIGDEPYGVIGVAPAGFTGPELGPVDVWLPGSIAGARSAPDWTTSWNTQWLKIVGRLKPGASVEDAERDATAAHHRAYTGGDKWTAEGRLTVASLRANDAGAETTEVRVLRWLTGVAALVLIIACANVANLMLARGVRRHREVAIRAALGAGRRRIVYLLLVDALLLAIAGAALGLAVAYFVGNLAREALFTSVEWTSSPVDTRVLAISALIAIVTGLIVGILPALRSTRANVTDLLRAGPRGGHGHRSHLRAGLTVVQAALSVVLLIGAGLFVRSLWQVRSLDLGIDPEQVVVIETSRPSLARVPESAREAERQRRRTFLLETLERVRAIPGVEQASVAVGLPFGNRFTVELRVAPPETVPRLKSGGPGISAVSNGYFETVGTRILRGRAFSAHDRTGSEPVAIVSEFMAQTIWPHGDAIGKCLYIGKDATSCTRVVGIAENTHRSRLREDRFMHYYIPAGQEVGFGGAALLVRNATPGVTADIRRLLTSLDSAITYVRAETIQERIDPQMRPWILGATVFALSGLLALAVAAIGIYSVMSYLIADRRHEIGVRMALGARAADIVRLVLRGSLALAAVGVLIGGAIAGLLGRFVEPLLFQTSPRDPLVFSGVGAVLLAVALAAALIPAARARAVNPVEALRAE